MPAHNPITSADQTSGGSLTEEQKWVKGINRGDLEAFEAFFGHYYKPLLHFIWGYVQSSDIAEELVQDLFMRVWEKREDLDPAGGIKTWLYRTARNLSIDYQRRQKVERKWEKNTRNNYDPLVSYKPAEDKLHEKWMAQAVEDAIADLPERRRLVFMMSRYNGMSHKEIASFLDISLNTVETQISRALKTLREKFEGFL